MYLFYGQMSAVRKIMLDKFAPMVYNEQNIT